MLSRLRGQRDIPGTLNAAVCEVVSLHGAEFGNVQLLGADGLLWLVTHKGLPWSFLETAAWIDPASGSACARALREGRMILIQDVHCDAAFAPFLELTRQASFRAVLSSPLISSRGDRLGVVSAHFANPKAPSDIEVAALESFCRGVADHLLSKAAASELALQATLLHAQMMRGGRVVA